MAEIGQDIHRAKALLKDGKVLGIPTETVYGLAANALDARAAARIFEIKGRPSFDPLIVHTDKQEKLEDFVRDIPDIFKDLFHAFSPGPLTVLLPKKSIVSDLITSGLPRVAVRIPAHPLALKLLSELDFPLAAPSANPFGYVSPTTAGHVDRQLGQKIEYILDGGACQIGLESTIVGLENGEITVYRKGGLPVEDIENAVGKVRVKEHSSSNPAAPGMMKSHYAPNKKMRLIGPNTKPMIRNNAGFLLFCESQGGIKPENQFILSEKADLNEAAQRLFYGLRYLDEQDIDEIYLELVPETGLGRAINDRLRRAARV